MPVLGPLVAYLQTPRSANGRLDVAALRSLVDSALDAGVDSLAVLGSVGGAAYMPRSMRKRVIATVAETAQEKVPLIAGIGALTTAEVLLNLHEARAAGATGALLQPMSYHPLLTHEVSELYRVVASESQLPLWVYNNPATTRHRFSVSELAAMAQFPNVAGFKDRAASSSEIYHRMSAIAHEIGEARGKELDWGFSGEDKGAAILAAGASTWHSALAGVLPHVCVKLADYAVKGKTDPASARRALEMQRALTPLTVVMGRYGSIRVAHTISRLRGLDVGALPNPLLELPPAAVGLVRLALASIERSLDALERMPLVAEDVEPGSQEAAPAASTAPISRARIKGVSKVTKPAESSKRAALRSRSQHNEAHEYAPQDDATQVLTATGDTPVRTSSRRSHATAAVPAPPQENPAKGGASAKGGPRRVSFKEAMSGSSATPTSAGSAASSETPRVGGTAVTPQTGSDDLTRVVPAVGKREVDESTHNRAQTRRMRAEARFLEEAALGDQETMILDFPRSVTPQSAATAPSPRSAQSASSSRSVASATSTRSATSTTSAVSSPSPASGQNDLGARGAAPIDGGVVRRSVRDRSSHRGLQDGSRDATPLDAAKPDSGEVRNYRPRRAQAD